MSILNYFFIGFVFVFIIDCIVSIYKNNEVFKKIPELNWKEKTICVIIWPLAILAFSTAFIKEYFKK